MTGTTAPTTRSSTVTARPVTVVRVVASEWIRFRTLRSSWVLLGAALAVLVGLAAAAAAVSTGSVTAPSGNGPQFDADDPLTTVYTGSNFAVLLLGVLGCLGGAREYGSRLVVTTMTAVPRRWPVLAARSAVLGGLVLVGCLVGAFAAFAVGMGVLAAGDAPTDALGDDGVLRAVVGMAGYLTAITLIGLGLGVALRSLAGSIGAVVGGVLVLPGIAGALLPAGFDPALRLLPTNAAAAFTAVTGGDDVLDPGAGVAVLAAWVVLVLAAATLGLLRRDV